MPVPAPIELEGDCLPDDESFSLPFLDPAAAFARTRVPLARVQIVPGLSVSCSLPYDRRSVTLDVDIHGIVVFHTTLDATRKIDRFSGHQGLFKEDIELGVDLGNGEVTLSGDICVLAPGGWRCVRFPKSVILAWSPTLGTVGGQLEAHAPSFTVPGAGSATSIVPTITRIPVDTVERAGTPVGSMVKKALFPNDPDFFFNVCFAVGPFKLFRPGEYGDPTSLWFNVFTGYYEIDCPKSSWKRPFGYTLTNGAPTVNFTDILRIGKADWNYFSNWMYGVPIDAVTPFDRPDPDVVTKYLGRVAIGPRSWDLVDADGFSVVSAYQSSSPGAARLTDNTPLTPLWRATYGEPNSQSAHPQSFPGTRLRAQLYMSYSEDDTTFRTYLFGGTVNKSFPAATNAPFLADQLTACRQIIQTHYPTLGFSQKAKAS